MFRVLFLFLLPLLTTSRVVNNARGRGAYTAAVVEFSPTSRAESPQALVEANLVRYEEFALQAREQNADVLVFPEYGLTTTSPSEDRDLCVQIGQEVDDVGINPSNPCLMNVTNPHQEVIRRLSCMARDNNLYLVANMIERQPCVECSDGFLIFNTNFAFDREGTVIAKYRKFNLFSEFALNRTSQADLSTFTTDFGATFGLFTCMDILFLDPAIQLVQERGVTDVAFPTAWFSELPFLTAVQAQAAWSYGFGVTLLASGYNRPQIGNTGSGVYDKLSAGSLVYLMAQETESRLLVARVPEMSTHRHEDIGTNTRAPEAGSTLRAMQSRDIFLKGDNMVNFTSVAVPGDPGAHNVSVCQANLCCYLEFELQTLPQVFSYRLLVLDGIMSHDGGFYQSRTQICGLVACSGNDTQSCADDLEDTTYSEKTLFKSARLYGTFNTTFVQPNTLVVPNLIPLQPTTDFNFTVETDIPALATLLLLKPTSSIHSYAIFAHGYE